VKFQRRCHVCERSIEGSVAYTRLIRQAEGPDRRVYAHPDCFFDELAGDEANAYQRELIGDDGAAPTRSGPSARQPEPQAAHEPDEDDTRPDREVVIDVDGLAKTYPDGTEAVKGVSFEVRRGEIFGMLGPNGAGKSTLIGMLGTLIRPSSGTGTVAGVNVREDPEALKQRLGFAMQEIGIDELATGREFLELQGRLYGLDKQTTRERADELLELFGLEEAADKRTDGYSGGMQRRIDLAGALIHEPEIIFLDEPTKGLDPRGRREMWKLVDRLNRELDSTILLSTHYMEEADALCDRLAIMAEGDIVVEGSPRELKAEVGQQAIVLEYDRGPDGDRIDEAERFLRSRSLASEVKRSRGQLHAFVEDPGRSTPRVLRELEQAGLGPHGLHVQSATLDDVYLSYTGTSLEEAAQEAKA
jgi:ABC-2 type transport system ATP-binding protein